MKEPFLLKWPLVCQTPSEVTTAHCQLPKTLLSILFICSFSSSHISVKMSWMWGYISLTTSKNQFLDMAWMPRHWFRVLWNFANPCPETINATARASPTTVLLDASTIDNPWKETLLNWHPLQIRYFCCPLGWKWKIYARSSSKTSCFSPFLPLSWYSFFLSDLESLFFFSHDAIANNGVLQYDRLCALRCRKLILNVTPPQKDSSLATDKQRSAGVVLGVKTKTNLATETREEGKTLFKMAAKH